MHWIRTNRRFGAWCALLAITLQVLLSFGHAHRIDGFRPGVSSSQAVVGSHAQAALEVGRPATKQPIGLAFEYCAICAVIKMGAAAVPAEAPASSLPVIAGKVRFTPYAEAAASTPERLLFEARAPPLA